MNEMERLTQLLNCLCEGNKTKLGDRLGISQQAASAWFTNHTYNVNKLQKAFPEVSTQWLLDGTGPMLESDIELDESFALKALGITREQLEAIRTCSATVPCDYPQGNKECTPARAYEQPVDPIYQVAEGQSVDRALLNMLLAEKAHLQQEIAVLRQRNLELEKNNARLEERFAGATAWYHAAITTHPDLKK